MNEHRTRTIAYIAFFAFFSYAVVAALFSITDWSRRAHVTVVGAVLEVIGIALLSMDFWWPGFVAKSARLQHWTRERTRSALEQARLAVERLLVSRGRVFGKVHSPIAAEVSTAGETAARRGKNNAQLVRELGELNARVDRVEASIEENRRAIIEEVQDLIRRSKDQYLGYRIVGLALAFAGSVTLAAANLIS